MHLFRNKQVNWKVVKRCNDTVLHEVNWIYVGHATIFGRMLTTACCVVVGFGLMGL